MRVPEGEGMEESDTDTCFNTLANNTRRTQRATRTARDFHGDGILSRRGVFSTNGTTDAHIAGSAEWITIPASSLSALVALWAWLSAVQIRALTSARARNESACARSFYPELHARATFELLSHLIKISVTFFSFEFNTHFMYGYVHHMTIILQISL